MNCRLTLTIIVVVGITIPNALAIAVPVAPAIETIIVDVFSNNKEDCISSSTVLTEGQTYYLLVEDTYRHAFDGQQADGEWDQLEPGGEWFENSNPALGPEEHDLLINDTQYNWLGSLLADPDPIVDFSTFAAHTYSPSHKYWLVISGDGAPIDLRIQDVYPGDNDGLLTVGIYTPEPCTLFLLGLGGLALLRKRRAK